MVATSSLSRSPAQPAPDSNSTSSNSSTSSTSSNNHNSQLHSSLLLRSKRVRTAATATAAGSTAAATATHSELDHDTHSHNKRRKIVPAQRAPQQAAGPLRMPLRGKTGPQLQAGAHPPKGSTSAPKNSTTAPKAVAADPKAPAALPKAPAALPKAPITAPIAPNTPPPTQSSTPTGKSQYEQIRLIEERARNSLLVAAAGHGNGNGNGNAPDDHRKLRKHGGTRINAELAQYFPNFRDMLSLDQHPLSTSQPSLSPRTTLVLLDDTPDYVAPPATHKDPFGAHKPLHATTLLALPIPHFLSSGHDPMADQVYEKIHRKHERHEKQMKNGDRERAQHEKYQLDRLLDELRGPDWLRTLGISGITETEKKRYEPKRLLFVREIQAMIDKFKWWKEEEKRRRLERQQEAREEAASASAPASAPTACLTGPTHTAAAAAAAAATTTSATTTAALRVKQRQRTASTTSAHEIDALAAQQLLAEAKSVPSPPTSVVVVETPGQSPTPSPPYAAYKPFTSFFEKRHLRDAAVSGRQRGRTLLAFGHPLPELLYHTPLDPDPEFCLPDTILTPDAIKANQRSRRRKRRGST